MLRGSGYAEDQEPCAALQGSSGSGIDSVVAEDTEEVYDEFGGQQSQYSGWVFVACEEKP